MHFKKSENYPFNVLYWIILEICDIYLTSLQLVVIGAVWRRYTLAHKHQFKILLKESCEIDYLHRLVLTSMWSEKLHHKSAKKSIKLW